jgi:uncharacterized protein YwqG
MDVKEAVERAKALRQPTISIVRTASGTASRFGGQPAMPADLPWPDWNGRPLDFIAQIDLAELPASKTGFGLPESGTLFFFFDLQEEPWGFEPEHVGGWRVLYAPLSAKEYRARQAPKGAAEPVPEAGISFTDAQSMPYWPANEVGDIEIDDVEEYNRAADELAKSGSRMFGWPYLIQNDGMEEEAQDMFMRVWGGSPGVRPPLEELKAGGKDWRLLLQLDNGDDDPFLFGDSARLYFWIREPDLKALKFDNIWMISQSY